MFKCRSRIYPTSAWGVLMRRSWGGAGCGACARRLVTSHSGGFRACTGAALGPLRECSLNWARPRAPAIPVWARTDKCRGGAPRGARTSWTFAQTAQACLRRKVRTTPRKRGTKGCAFRRSAPSLCARGIVSHSSRQRDTGAPGAGTKNMGSGALFAQARDANLLHPPLEGEGRRRA
jgi:hypothetical protein